MSSKNSNHYPPDALAVEQGLDTISTGEAATLDEVFRERVRRSADKVAYCQFDFDQQKWFGQSWAEMAAQVERWQVAFRDQGLEKGDRVAICYKNSIEWVLFDQAALRLGLVVVPLYTADRADNIGYVIGDSGAKLVLMESSERWHEVLACDEDISSVATVVVFNRVTDTAPNLSTVDEWLPEHGQHFERGLAEPDDLASIVYTSGTTGRPKGVMLSHKNILSNAYGGLRSVALTPADRMLSFLPLSHTLERTVGYYAAMLSGASVTFNRAIPELNNDLLQIKPTVMISVPRIFERVHNKIYSSLESESPFKQAIFKRAIKTGWHQFLYQQGDASWHPRLLLHSVFDRLVAKGIRARLGGQLDYVIVGGAPLSLEVAKTFTALGIPLLQGYGLTESSPVVSVNTKTRNRPDSIGMPLRGVEVKLMDNDELWVRGDSVMQGYWGNIAATDKTMSGDWLKTGDRASIDAQGFIRIIGRIKDILVLANGEKVPPSDIEAAILRAPLFEQALVLGEGKSYLTALLVLNQDQWQRQCQQVGLAETDLSGEQAQTLLVQRIAEQMEEFPGYAKIRKVRASFDEWTVESGLLTPTLKKKRAKIVEQFAADIAAMYAGHGVHKS